MCSDTNVTFLLLSEVNLNWKREDKHNSSSLHHHSSKPLATKGGGEDPNLSRCLNHVAPEGRLSCDFWNSITWASKRCLLNPLIFGGQTCQRSSKFCYFVFYFHETCIQASVFRMNVYGPNKSQKHLDCNLIHTCN